MAVYNPKSLNADEFINDEEIRETLAYAEEHKNDRELIDQILEKARPRLQDKGYVCKGLTHREASVLLASDLPDVNEKIFEIANEIKLAYYGNRIVMFAPLYLSNYCVNGCLYCPYHLKNKHIPRKKLTQEELREEVIALQDLGHKRLAIEAGEDPVNNPIEYILDCIHTIYSIHHKNGDIRRVNVNIAATTVENYRKLQSAETYDSADLDNMIDREFSITLDKMMRDKGVSTTELVKSTSLSKAYINRLRDPSRKNDKPKREVVIDIALGINAALDEANLLLKRARYQELYTRDKAESVIIWGMLKKLSGAEIRELLAEKGLLDTIFPEKKEK